MLPGSIVDFPIEARSRFVRRHSREMVHITNWTGKNKMILNLLMEVVFHGPSVSHALVTNYNARC